MNMASGAYDVVPSASAGELGAGADARCARAAQRPSRWADRSLLPHPYGGNQRVIAFAGLVSAEA